MFEDLLSVEAAGAAERVDFRPQGRGGSYVAMTGAHFLKSCWNELDQPDEGMGYEAGSVGLVWGGV